MLDATKGTYVPTNEIADYLPEGIAPIERVADEAIATRNQQITQMFAESREILVQNGVVSAAMLARRIMAPNYPLIGSRSEFPARQFELYGSVMAYPFLPYKASTKPLVAENSYAPKGWNSFFPESIQGKTVPGYSAFTINDIAVAVEKIWADGQDARIKRAVLGGGKGHHIMSLKDFDKLERVMNKLEKDEEEINTFGAVVEYQLSSLTEKSVGTVSVGGFNISYVGEQFFEPLLTGNGDQRYVGSRLIVARGGLDRLGAAFRDEHATSKAIDAANTFADAFNNIYGGEAYVTRQNYDFIMGVGRDLETYAGITEQGPFLGGASASEAEAIRIFASNKRIKRVTVETLMRYELMDPGPNARVLYRGEDPKRGPMTIFTQVLGTEP